MSFPVCSSACSLLSSFDFPDELSDELVSWCVDNSLLNFLVNSLQGAEFLGEVPDEFSDYISGECINEFPVEFHNEFPDECHRVPFCVH